MKVRDLALPLLAVSRVAAGKSVDGQVAYDGAHEPRREHTVAILEYLKEAQ
jgi:hypothetical protein